MDKKSIGKEGYSNMFCNLLDVGVWHFGLVSKEGKIISDTELWPKYPERSNGDIVWQNEHGELKPIVWFGENDANSNYCLSLFDRDSVNADIGDDYIRFIRSCRVEKRILHKLNEVKKSCPISIAKNDSKNAILIRVEEYCYHMQKRHVLEKALYDYGYDLGLSFVEKPINSGDFDDSVLLPDGRLTPSFISEWAYEQMSEDLYGDAQADMIDIDNRYFLNEHEGDSSYYWNVLERYFDDAEEYALKGLYKCLEDNYGEG